MPHPKVKIADNSGNEVSVTDNRLDVNATIGATIAVALDSDNDSVECIQDTAAHLLATVTQASAARTITGTVEVVQDTPADLTATVTQASTARTVTGTVGHNITGMQSYNKEDVSSSSEAVLKSSTACKRVDMQADSANTGYIYVGGSDVSATKGIRLAAGDFYSIDIDNTADIYVLASVNNEDIHFTVYT